MNRFAGLIAALALAASMTACGDGGKESETTPVAVVGPVTGQYASFGAQMSNGGQMAVDDIKRSGRSTQGVIVMRLREGEHVSSLAPVVEAAEDKADATNTPEAVPQV